MSNHTGPMGADLATLSRVTSHALRHEPWIYELELDAEGWVSIHALVDALRNDNAAWRDLSEHDLAQMIDRSSKRRHEISNGRIRALYGHSIPGKLKRTPAEPPSVLYHGTAPDLVSLIKSSGLQPMNRQYVHLSSDEATAAEVGRRKARTPTILLILAGQAHAKGALFSVGNEKVWLADFVQPEFIAFDQLR